MSFYTSDDISRYKVIVEGITDMGEICLGTMDIVVNLKNKLHSADE